jgi:hypothetical protein
VQHLFDLQLGFWVSLAALAGVSLHAWNHRREAWGLPALAVCGTVLAWYHGNVIYGDYKTFSSQFSYEAMAAAWWQVTAFAVSFGILAPVVHGKLNPARIGRHSTVLALLGAKDALARLQRPLKLTLGPLAAIWSALSVAALLRTDFDWSGLFAPWLGHLASPWARPRVGGSYDFLLALVGYVNVFCLAGFGVVAALAKSPRLCSAALGLAAVSWPMIFFDRTRNTMLAVLLPGLLCLVFLRLRGRPLVQAGVLVSVFLAVSSWFAFVLAHRSSESIAAAFAAGKLTEKSAEKHEGLNMFEELCWINTFLHDGAYRPNWGLRYLAEAVNVIPRGVWKDKPTIGLDYAVLRGLGQAGKSDESVNATVSTGMIGQGVVNFGPWGGPPAAALLMSAWVAMLARFDLTGYHPGRLLLYALGLVLTFNLGRDITLLVAFPLVFGYAIVRFAEKWITPASAGPRAFS